MLGFIRVLYEKKEGNIHLSLLDENQQMCGFEAC